MEESGTSNKNKKTLKVLLAISLSILIFASGLIIGLFCRGKDANKINKLLNLIDENAVYQSDGEDLAEKAIVNAILSKDKYAVYYTKEEYSKIMQQDKGRFTAFGFSFYYTEDRQTDFEGGIAYIAVNSSAYKNGLLVGDKIVKAKKSGGEFFDVKNNSETTSFFAGIGEDEQITILVNREGVFSEREFVISKSFYVTSYVKYIDSQIEYNFISEDGKSTKGQTTGSGNSSLSLDTAYVRLEEFEGNADKEFAEVMDLMKTRNRTKLILDLRDNGGGYMTILQNVSSYLINNNGKNKNLISVAIEKDGNQESYYTNGNHFNKRMEKIVVLANGNTASASECLIGAMLYYGDGFSADNLVLTYNSKRENYSTFGKGIMQSIYNFSDGSAVKFTTAKIYQPDKKTCIQDTGIETPSELNRVENEDALKRAIQILS
ncbi:MAG: S41 family peptidase [Clostridia bacterium]|nr:S41 family peptidase [Clostridia bacterium]